MKKLILVLFVAVFAVGCSKDNDKKPESELFGTWKATSFKEVYQNADGTPFRDQWITEDDIDNDPDLRITINAKSIMAFNEEEAGEESPYVAGKDYIDISFEGEKQRMYYTVNGNNLVLNQTEVDVNIYDDVIVGKIMTTITLIRQ